MSNAPRNLTRKQLAEFLPDARAVRAFEQLLKLVADITPENLAALSALIQDNATDTSTALSRSQEASASATIDKEDSDVAVSSLSARVAALEAIIAPDQDVVPKALADDSAVIDYIDFSTAAPIPAGQVGRARWGRNGTLELSMGGGNITQQVGEEFFIYGKASAAITEGQPVMITGTVGASGVVTFAPAAIGVTNENLLVGVATENIPHNGFGRVTTMGTVRGIDTSGSSVGEVWADGDILWYNPAVVGGFTKTKPVAPNIKTQMATVINASSGGSGSLTVEVVHGSTLGGTDSNVELGPLAQDHLLQYNAALGYWVNALPKMRVIAMSAVAVVAPNDLLENTLATIVIPANVMGLNGLLRIRTSWSVTNNANNKTTRVRFGGTAYYNAAFTAVATVAAETYVINRGTANSQISNYIAGSGIPFGSSALGLVTSAIDTTAPVNLTITAQKALATDSITLQSYTVELLTP